MKADVSTLSKEKAEALIDLKGRIKEEFGTQEAEDEYRLLRFLRARDYNVDNAQTMLRNHFEWRKKFQIDTILEDVTLSEVFVKYFPRSEMMFDRDGDIVYYFGFGDIDLRGYLKMMKKRDFLKSCFYLMEKDVKLMEEKSKKEGKHYERWTYIFDFEHFALADATYKDGMDIYLSFFKAYEANYPERLKKGFAINTSLYFNIAYAVIKPLLSEATVSKLRIHGKNGWKEELAELVDPNVLPAFLGGNLKDSDGDPRCPSKINPGGLIPKKYYSTKSNRRLSIEPGVKRFSVSRLSHITIEVDVTQPMAHIEWEFETTNHDIGFGLRYRENDESEMQELIPVQRMDTRMFTEAGTFLCKKPGIYVVVFDNGFSWIRSKELFCRVHIVLPDGKRICATS